MQHHRLWNGNRRESIWLGQRSPTLSAHKSQPLKVLCKGRLRSQQTPLQIRPIFHSRYILHNIFGPCCSPSHSLSHAAASITQDQSGTSPAPPHQQREAGPPQRSMAQAMTTYHTGRIACSVLRWSVQCCRNHTYPKAQGRGRAWQPLPFPMIHGPAAKAQHCSCG